MSKHKENILRLRAEGKSYNEIQKITGASKGTISYHCGEGQKHKAKRRHDEYRAVNKVRVALQKKVDHFKRKPRISSYEIVNDESFEGRVARKIRGFQRRADETAQAWGIEEFYEMFGGVNTCYLTGCKVDIYDPDTFSLDHIVPRAAGGSGDITNVGIVSPHANRAKYDMELEEFILMCFDVVEYWSED